MKATAPPRSFQSDSMTSREKADGKGISTTRSAALCDEKRSALHTGDTGDTIRAKPELKGSKLRQPEVKITDKYRTTSSTSTPTSGAKPVGVSVVNPSSSYVGGSSAPTKKLPPAPEKQDVTTRADEKGSSRDLSLHTVRSVQSLANEIRRIRSMRVDEDDSRERVHLAADERAKAKKKGSARSKIKLEIADLEPESRHAETSDNRLGVDKDVRRDCKHDAEDSAPPACKPTQSPTFRDSPSTAGSTGKKGISRNFVQGLGAAFQLDLQQSQGDGIQQLHKSYDLSASGTFDAVGFQIKQTGLTRSPDRETGASATPQPLVNTKKNLVKLGILGRGASGVVHKALHMPSLLLVAVKVIPVFENEKRHQLIAELKALYNNLSTLSDDDDAAHQARTVACPEIVCLYDAFMNPNEGNVSIVVEYMDGGSLQDIVDTGGCTSESVLANISYRVLKGLQFLHSTHQLHRDIKPGNLLINHFGDVKVSDFGIVKEMENSVAKATTFVGTLTYMSPERIASEAYSYKSDVWSFGLSIMTCALGKFPYASKGGYWELLHMIRNEPPPQLPKGEFSDLFRDFLDKCLQKDQSERWSVKQLLTHDFILRYVDVRRPLSHLNGEDNDDESGDADAKSPGCCDDSKDQQEMDEIVHKAVEYYMKEAKERVVEHGYSLDNVIGWIQGLPAMQKPKLVRLADQIGASRRLLCSKFQVAMNDLLQDIQEAFFDDVKAAK